ncbi:MAG: glycosyltransferase family 39 protein [Prolixibacteraceae bacterium]|jgi:4-amino-4-deoxy-L-arabinose transferase-like glycosyltransferase|nr:glycosyltransferase family 39 protein [Prolixibacteraceae bacterium]
MLKNKTILIIFLAITGLMLISYISGLSVDVTRDAGKYATVAKEIFQKGNFINLTIHGEPYDQKPPLLFWLGALGFSLGGISNFWFKLPVLLLVFFGFYSAYQLGKSLYSKKVGLLTVFMMAFSLIYMLYSMDIHTDTPLQAFVTFALWQFFEFIKTQKNRHWILGFLATGLAMLCKGPIGALIPAFAVAGHLLLKKNFKAFADYRWYLGILLSLAVVSPALAGLYNQFGIKGLRFFFWDNNIGRVTGSYVQSNNDPVFYFHTLLYIFLPWSVLFFIAAYHELKTLIANRFKADEYFTFAGIWIFFIILNISKNQLPNYIFIIIPLISVLTAKWTDIALNQKTGLFKTFTITQLIIVLLLWAGIAFISVYLFPYPDWHFWLIAAGGLAVTLYLYLFNKNRAARLLLPSGLVFAVIALLFNTHVFPYMFSFQAPPAAARYFNEHSSPDEILYNFNYPQYELFFYSEPQALQLSTPESARTVAGKEGIWLFTDEEGYNMIQNFNVPADTTIVYEHLYLNRGSKFINPRTRDKVLKPMYLIKY